jgi:hypothetical protein
MRIDAEYLAQRYAGMNEFELIELARSYDALTEVAQGILRTEFARRGLDPPLLDEEDRVERRDMVTVRRYRDVSEAIVARSLLESSDLYAFLCDENLVRLDWQVSNFIGGIRLQVEKNDEAAALALLGEPIPSAISFGDELAFEQPRCPACGSIDIAFQGSSRGVALASLYLLSLPLPLGRETWMCNACSARWEETDDPIGLE